MRRNFSYGARKSRPGIIPPRRSVDYDQLKRLMLLYQHMVAPVVVKHFGVACCIPATHATLKVFEQFGFQARPMSVRANLLSPNFVKALDAEGMEFSDVTPQWLREHPEVGITILGLGATGERLRIGDKNFKRVEVHVVAIIENRWLLDTSLGQVNYGTPAPGTDFPRAHEVCLTTVTKNFLAGRGPLRVTPDMLTCRLFYTASPDDHDFLQSPAWNDEGIGTVAAGLADELKKLMDRSVILEM
jgi:hypothetical protein